MGLGASCSGLGGALLGRCSSILTAGVRDKSLIAVRAVGLSGTTRATWLAWLEKVGRVVGLRVLTIVEFLDNLSHPGFDVDLMASDLDFWRLRRSSQHLWHH